MLFYSVFIASLSSVYAVPNKDIIETEKCSASVDNTKANKNFDITYINLEKNKDRNSHMNIMLNFANCNFKRFNAVNGKEVFFHKTKKIEEYLPAEFNNKINFDIENMNYARQFDGLLGCKLSHYIVLKELSLKKNAKPLLIVEDDLDIHVDFTSIVSYLIDVAPKEWDIILCSSQYEVKYDSPYELHMNLLHVNYFYECLAYIVNGEKAAQKLVDRIEVCNHLTPVDIIIGNMCVDNTILGLGIYPFLARQRREFFGSDIEASDNLQSIPEIPSLMDRYMSFLQTDNF